MNRVVFACFIGAGVVACVSSPKVPCKGDEDGDGYLPAQCTSSLPVDCDDQDEAVHPGALEFCGNVQDEDCSGKDLDCASALVSNSSRNTQTRFIVENGQVRVEFGTSSANNNPALVHLAAVQGSGANLLYQGPMEEKLVGVAQWPHVSSWQTSAPVDWEDDWVKENNAAIVRLDVPWQASNGTDEATLEEGVSSYTIYPDGRIHRREQFRVTTTTDDSYLTAYVALDAQTAVNRVIATTNVQTDSSRVVGETDRFGDVFFTGPSTERSSLCAYHADRGERVGWSYAVENGQPLAGARATESMLSAHQPGSLFQVAFQFDWVREQQVPSGSYRGNFLLHVGTIDVGDADVPCRLATQYADVFSMPTAITSDLPVTYVQEAGYYELTAKDPQTVQWTLPSSGRTLPSSSYRIRELHLVYPPIIELRRSGETVLLVHGADYVLQPSTQEPTHWWLFVARELVADDQLILRAPQ